MTILSNSEQELISTHVAKYVDIQKQLIQLRKKIKELKDAQIIVEKQIIDCMKTNELPEINLNSGKIVLKAKESKKNLPPKWFKGEIGKCAAGNTADDIRESLNEIITMIDNRPFTLKDKLIYRN